MIDQTQRPGIRWTALGVVTIVIALPIMAVGFIALWRTLDVASWIAGAADAAFVASAAITLLLLLRWRLVGEAACVPLAAAAVVTGSVLVPATTHVAGSLSGRVSTVWATAVVVVLALDLYGLRTPAVQAGIRPTRFVGVSAIVVVVVGLGLALSPVRVVAAARWHGIDAVDVGEALACALVASAMLVRGVRTGRALFVGMGAAAASLGAACAALAGEPPTLASAWRCLPAFFLLVGAVVLLAVSGGALRSAISAAVLLDVRGRRRWESAEAELTAARSRYQGRAHDLQSMLSAMDGTLLVLRRHRDALSVAEVDRLVQAVRDQVHWLRSLLAGGDEQARSYDLAELLSALVSVRSAAAQRVRCEVEPNLGVRGHPDRLAMAVNNLLANAAVHAPGADVVVRARSIPGSCPRAVEVAVADDGPGLTDAERSRAFERGWQGSNGGGSRGSGLGLAQCRELVEAEGGHVTLGLNDGDAPLGCRGLCVTLRIPVDSCEIPNSVEAHSHRLA